MQHAAFVRRGQTGADLARELDGFVLRQSPDAAQQRIQILAVEILHREEVETFDESDIVDAADVGMGNLPGDADFIAESRQRGFTNLRGGRET